MGVVRDRVRPDKFKCQAFNKYMVGRWVGR